MGITVGGASKLLAIVLLVLGGAAGSAQSHAQTDPLGDRPALDPDHLIFHEPMEDGIFSDNWYAYQLEEEDGPVAGLYVVVRDGKSGDFSASLSLDCANRSSTWEWGVLYGSELVGQDYFEQQVPPQVAQNALARYCP
ncbi:hypothetical protein H0E84_00800 [Luteimonas sp. SJ-92]|uniref:Uncharacterized protein n=1 Tax=Luteimonas salinisoli TaxID=2752307 RepID=A0A853J777_9GAMM|nr:hypothetical protein [Luteimonas salinisoli]NZA24913.1 hypothetical protein [Luteimonas salinisoli]